MTTVAQEEKIAVLLTALGNDVTNAVLAGLPAEAAQRVRQLLDRVQDEPLAEEDVEDVLEDFMRFFRFALQQQTNHQVDEEIGDDEDPGNEGPAIAGQVKPASAENAKGTPSGEGTSEALPEFEPTGDPFVDINRLQPVQIAAALKSEHPRTVAIVLNCLAPSQAGFVLQFLPEAVRSSAFLGLRTPPTAPAPLLHRLLESTVEKARYLDASALADPTAENNKRLADVLRVMSQADRGAMLKSLESEDAEAAAAIKRMLYLFEDIRTLSDRSIQKILAEIDSRSLVVALKGADQDLQDKIMGNMSKRARATLLEEMEFLGQVKPNEQAVARQSIGEVMARLDEAGDLEVMS